MTWVQSPFKSQNERIKRLRSIQFEKTAPSSALEREAMMVFVKIDD
jgi:hypothetical protein